ncbi:MAG: ABC transporter substrate-binding protein, partial [Anaerovoracaceae bacterium]
MNTSTVKRILPLILSLMLMLSLASCGSSTEKKVVIYSNADEEAKVAMAETLDAKGYKDKYILQSFGTSELGGKIQGEGTNIEADLVTISSYYLDAAQKEKSMFTPLDFDYTPLDEKKDFYAPLLAFEGSIIVNTKVLAENNLPLPTTLKDLSTPQYKGMISMVDLMGSSTGWLMVQAILSEYGDVQGKEVLSGIYNNAGAHLEPSGSGPIKKIRAGEVAI